MSMLLVPRSTTLVSAPVRRSRWKRSDRSWMWRNTLPASRRAASWPTLSKNGIAQIVEQHAAEARAGVSDDQRDDDAERAPAPPTCGRSPPCRRTASAAPRPCRRAPAARRPTTRALSSARPSATAWAGSATAPEAAVGLCSLGGAAVGHRL